jgi:hypothetical protein
MRKLVFLLLNELNSQTTAVVDMTAAIMPQQGI